MGLLRNLFRRPNAAPVERLGTMLLLRAREAGARRISFGTPPGCAPPPTLPVPAVPLWHLVGEDWRHALDLPATLLSATLENLELRLAGLPSAWSAEGHPLRLEHDGRAHDLRVRLSVSPQGTHLVDLE